MKLLTLLALAITGLAIDSYSQTLTSKQDLKDVIVELTIEDDDMSLTEELGLFVQFREINGMTWHELISKNSGLIFPFKFSVPSPAVVSVQITTSDPTIIASSSKKDFYILEVGKKSIIAQTEVRVGVGGDPQVRIPIFLRRVSAVKLCTPSGFRSGAVQLVKRSSKATRALVYAVADRKLLDNRWFAGINHGIWDVIYLDDEDNVLFRAEVLLSKGETGSTDCR